jgi:hypothetical protein
MAEKRKTRKHESRSSSESGTPPPKPEVPSSVTPRPFWGLLLQHAERALLDGDGVSLLKTPPHNK